MINKKIVVAALCRDCNDSLINNIPRIEKLCSLFAESCVVVVENDSKDGTKESLARWADNNKSVAVIGEDSGELTITKPTNDDPVPCFGMNRIAKMSRFRNIYLQYIRENIDDVDYVIMVDIDIPFFDVNSIVKTIDCAPSDWGGLFADGANTLYFIHHKLVLHRCYYDMYAYRHTNEDISLNIEQLQRQRKALRKRINRTVYSQCTSAFGGMAIYKWSYINDLEYCAIPNQHKKIKAYCEHIPFNEKIIAKGGALYISKYFDVRYRSESFAKMLCRKFNKLILKKKR